MILVRACIADYNTTVELVRNPNRLWAFTSGIFASGLRNEEFAIRTNIDTDTSYTILAEANSNISAGINAMFHVGGYFSDHSEWGWFASFGPGLTLEKSPQVRVMLGTGLMFGRHNKKLALSFGMTAGNVKRLSSIFKTNEAYTYEPKDIFRDRFGYSWYASLGYALFNK